MKVSVPTAILSIEPENGGNSEYPATTPIPAEIKFDTGFGLEAGDVSRGFANPKIASDPATELRNYRGKWSESNQTPDQMADEFNFRYQDQESKGFLVRDPYDRSRF